MSFVDLFVHIFFQLVKVVPEFIHAFLQGDDVFVTLDKKLHVLFFDVDYLGKSSVLLFDVLKLLLKLLVPLDMEVKLDLVLLDRVFKSPFDGFSVSDHLLLKLNLLSFLLKLLHFHVLIYNGKQIHHCKLQNFDTTEGIKLF